MYKIAILATTAVLVATGGSAAFAQETSSDRATSSVGSHHRAAEQRAGDDHRARHHEAGDDHGRRGAHREAGDDHGRHGGHGADD